MNDSYMAKYNLRATIYYWPKWESEIDPKTIEIMQSIDSPSHSEALATLETIVLQKEEELQGYIYDTRHDGLSVRVDWTEE